jgi:hypothetical protein
MTLFWLAKAKIVITMMDNAVLAETTAPILTLAFSSCPAAFQAGPRMSEGLCRV